MTGTNWISGAGSKPRYGIGYSNFLPELPFRFNVEARVGQRGSIPERELRLRLASLWLDRETMIRVFHWDPEPEGY